MNFFRRRLLSGFASGSLALKSTLVDKCWWWWWWLLIDGRQQPPEVASCFDFLLTASELLSGSVADLARLAKSKRFFFCAGCSATLDFGALVVVVATLRLRAVVLVVEEEVDGGGVTLPLELALLLLPRLLLLRKNSGVWGGVSSPGLVAEDRWWWWGWEWLLLLFDSETTGLGSIVASC